MTKHHDEEIVARHRAKMNQVASVLDGYFNQDVRPKKVCFVLLITEFGGMADRVNYISNGQRADVVTMLKEILARFEGQAEAKGRA